MFPVSAFVVIAFVIATAAAPRRALIFFDYLQSKIAESFSWLYLASMTGFLLFAIYLCFSRFGNIRLGSDDERPEFSTVTWFAMLFSAGMGIGMLFFGVAEPMLHFVDPPNIRNGVVASAESLAAARGAMGITLFHWCLHPWALYSLVGVSLAYFSFRRGLPLSFRSVFYPILGKRIHGLLGDSIDILAVVATLFGLATSLGLGAKQINAGLSFVFGLPQSTTVQIILITCITTLAVGSLLSGLHVGVRRLSELNMLLAGSLLLFLFVAGPTVYLLGAVVDNAGAYAERLPHASFWTASYARSSKSQWLASWTVFYWGWWIAWSPFVGMFIARVSRGRTIREFITGVLLVPTAVAILWLTGFGNTAMHQEIYKALNADAPAATAFYDYSPQSYAVQQLDPQSGLPQSEDGEWLIGATAIGVASPQGVKMRQQASRLVTKSGNAVEYYRGVLVHAGTEIPYHPSVEERFDGRYKSEDTLLSLAGYLTEPVLTSSHRGRVDTTATAMFVMLGSYPFATITALAGIVCVILFFVTSSDSASLVADIIASGGSHNPTIGTRLFWGILEGVLASVLLLAGGLKALQTGSIAIGLPFCVLIIVMCVSLMKALRQETNTETPTA
ncbi:BCCT family transporter [Novipirellula maiorica]|uniref:BCCT family transporter n=1 Tax=Novipirellula maiorica TaxID=1265734 RepID=UPI001F4569D1|nr:BCCT family transporter [Rhodopirellula maiorica]